ncbi:gluconate 2-dehydrogenase subunit 3 family protein [Croceivirga thetidis]|uniref:Gluconate 2-dehydrogenase subunit 3 family protein n=1 Tax=Croceivirga thetidis TaxID=2721623 RepID=A0ABX1GTQ6_9FLAO|nr:gluconate 2-dehydrogenase subunit 3 family protein [Croceivirga thetidis]NKI33313.1 gluconate 2-dehydrogenase subunit 3 family protein [Croceivirga thetidis]
MDRRKSLKSIMLGSVATGLAATGCKPGEKTTDVSETLAHEPVKWRTKYENKILEEIKSEDNFFNDHQRETMTVLCDLILPATENYKAASDVDVVGFIDFMARDRESEAMQTDLKGGLMWLDHKCNTENGVEFKGATEAQQKEILDTIAYYDPEVPESERPFEVNFFSMVRNMTMTGFYTSKIGIEELGYKGNMPNVWNGVPDDVLEQHGVSYDPEWLAKCVDQSKRNTIAEWDENGNLLT